MKSALGVLVVSGFYNNSDEAAEKMEKAMLNFSTKDSGESTVHVTGPDHELVGTLYVSMQLSGEAECAHRVQEAMFKLVEAMWPNANAEGEDTSGHMEM